MPPLFTRFVLSLEGTPDERLALAAWDRLREILQHELKRRGLWLHPPSYLGICGWPNWAGTPEEPAAALEELVAECYAFIFVDRLGRLQAQLKAKPNIEGLVLLNVRHFFLERQKEHDPLGYRVYEMLHAAVHGAVHDGELYVLEGDPEVRNETVLGLAAGKGEAALPSRLVPLVGPWTQELLPELVLARGRHQEEVWIRIRRLIRALEPEGISAFRFRDVLDPLKRETRLRWAALLEESDEGGAKAVPAGGKSVLPDTPIESRQSLERLTRYVAAALAHSSLDERTRDHLTVLWQYLRLSTGTAEGPGGGTVVGVKDIEEDERFSHRRIAQLLGIPRERLPGLFATLREWVREAETSARGARSPGSGVGMFEPRRPSPAPRRPEPVAERPGPRRDGPWKERAWRGAP
jgi:hypothetical protein